MLKALSSKEKRKRKKKDREELHYIVCQQIGEKIFVALENRKKR